MTVYFYIHGGSWYTDVRYVRVARRDGVYPSDRFSNIGFRVVRSFE